MITLGEKIKRDAAWVRHLESTEYYTRDGKLKQAKIDSRTVLLQIVSGKSMTCQCLSKCKDAIKRQKLPYNYGKHLQM